MTGSKKGTSLTLMLAILIAIAAVLLGQYVGVTTGNGGGSPRLVPSTLAPEIQPPTTGYALWVFALPDKR